MLADLVSSAIEIVFNLIAAVLNILPASFVMTQLDNLGSLPFLSYVNWFIPFNEMKPIMAIWLTACTAVLVASIVKNNVKS